MGPDGNVCAWADDGVVMGIEHRKRPMWGVQFHPESIATDHGARLVENFYELARQRKETPVRATKRPDGARPRNTPAAKASPSETRLLLRSIPGEASTEALFERLFAAEEHAFWLDSADAPTRLAQSSYLGTSAGRDRCVLEYDVEEGAVRAHRADGTAIERGSIFDVLDREVAVRAIERPGERGAEPARRLRRLPRLRVQGRLRRHQRAQLRRARRGDDAGQPGRRRRPRPAPHPRAGGLRGRRGGRGDEPGWTRPRPSPATCSPTRRRRPSPADPAFGEPSEHPRALRLRPRPRAVPRRHRPLAGRDGRRRVLRGLPHRPDLDRAEPDPFDLYRNLRRSNPAPFAAFLKLGDVAVVSSSPERFLSVDRERRVEARPIKGTTKRSADPAEDAALKAELTNDEKTYAEHLMIVDLLRNDLGIVCEVGSVAVPELMVVEDYATVHQLISTVEGRLPADRSAVECARACFPGGSMTGAPKLRTMEIIDDIEAEARGVYSGAIGYFGLDGVMDLSIVIRTIVLREGRTTIGAGGAIVMQSDPVDEFDEILLKARAPMAAIARTVTGSDSPDSWSVELEPARGGAADGGSADRR